jgi:predicted enzyme related to lactoylglutathione lyase
MENKQHPTMGNGKICYIEIPALDIQLSATFYEKTFGWQLRKNDDGSISFDDAVGEVSGMWVTGRKISTEPGIIVSIMVDNIEDTVSGISNNGGNILQTSNPNASERTAIFTDPAGNIFSIYLHR